jgi:hypothetical protein
LVGKLGDGRGAGGEGVVVARDVHLFDAAEVRGQVVLEAAGYEGARGVAAGEEVVGAAGAVAGVVLAGRGGIGVLGME